jgi:hypothetical protein
MTDKGEGQRETQMVSIPKHLPVVRTDSAPIWLRNEDPENPGWLTSISCGEGPIKRMIERERIFWKQLIKKYLFPINEDKMHQEKVAADLKNLRNNVRSSSVFGFESVLSVVAAFRNCLNISTVSLMTVSSPIKPKNPFRCSFFLRFSSSASLLVFIFFVSALFHPEEFACLIPGALYFICIPTGYLVLTIYYLSNLT